MIKQISINDESLTNEITDLINKLKGIQPQIYIKMASIDSSNTIPLVQDSTPKYEDSSQIIEEINNSDITKLEPPIYAHKSKHFSVCIYKALYQNRDVAIKMYMANFQNIDDKRIYDEIQIYQTLSKLANHHNCFLKYYGTYREKDKINMVMDYYETNLMEKLSELSKSGNKLSENVIIHMYKQMITSFAEMESLGIYHGDIKPHNLLIDDF